MAENSFSFSMFWVELWHGLLLLSTLALLLPLGLIEPWALLAGGLFMGLNFFLMACGIQRVLAPYAEKGKVRIGVFLLILKMLLFLGLLSALFFKVRLDALSFTLGVSCLLLAIILERISASRRSA